MAVILPSETISPIELAYARDCGHIVSVRPPRAYPPSPPPKPHTYPAVVANDHEQFCEAQGISRPCCPVCRDSSIREAVNAHLSSYSAEHRRNKEEEERAARDRSKSRQRKYLRQIATEPTPEEQPEDVELPVELPSPVLPVAETTPEEPPLKAQEGQSVIFSNGGDRYYIGSHFCEHTVYARHCAATLLDATNSSYYVETLCTLSEGEKRLTRAKVEATLAARGYQPEDKKTPGEKRCTTFKTTNNRSMGLGYFLPDESTFGKHVAARLLGKVNSAYYQLPKIELSAEQRETVAAKVRAKLLSVGLELVEG